jgi:hypothetical protein
VSRRGPFSEVGCQAQARGSSNIDDRFSRYESLRAALDLSDQGFTLIDSNLRFAP